jgi:hypothetical protein
LLELALTILEEKLTLHYTAQCIEDGLRGEILRGNQVDEVLLALLFLSQL